MQFVKSNVSTSSVPLVFVQVTHTSNVSVVDTNPTSGPWEVRIGSTSIGSYAVQADAEAAASALVEAVGDVYEP